MSIEQLTSIEEEFTKYLQIIRNQSKSLPKCQVLRIGAWLKKLCSVVDNYFWRKNRNLYAEVLALMLQEGTLQTPFDKSPPQGSLPKLTIYQIPFSIRQKLESYRIKNEDKQNNLQQSNLSLNKKNSFDSNNMRYKKRQSLALNSLKSVNDVGYHDNSKQNQNLQHIQTERKNREKKSHLRQLHSFQNMRNQEKQKQKNQLVMSTMSEILVFLAKNNQQFEGDISYIKLLEEIVQFGDQTGCNFRQLKYSLIQQ